MAVEETDAEMDKEVAIKMEEEIVIIISSKIKGTIEETNQIKR